MNTDSKFLASRQRLLQMYLEHTRSADALAIIFSKMHLTEAKGHWVDIIDCRNYERSLNDMHFKFVVGRLYERKLRPKYPPKSMFTRNGVFDEREYRLLVRAITWETANKDIEQQESKGIVGTKFKVIGVSYDKNRGNSNFFRSDAPPEIKELAKNLSDRTDPLWDKAMSYVNYPEFVYEVKSAKLI